MASNGQQDQPIKPQLGLFDAVSIIIGIVIGSSIYVIPIFINENLGSPTEVIFVWALGGVLCLIGALCYAELATAYPRMGGDYFYLNKAFGSWFGFQFGWAQLAVILTASIGMMGFVFGQYAVKLLRIGAAPPGQPEDETLKQVMIVVFALVAISGLTAINILGVVMGKMTQNILTLTKVLGLGTIIVVGLSYGQESGAWDPHPATSRNISFGTALILVLYAYGGWNDAAFVASEMRNRRHIPTTLLLGTGGVMVIYLLVNIAYINGLGFSNIQGFHPDPIAARVVEEAAKKAPDPSAWGWAVKGISVLVMISALGAINGLLFAGSRVCAALGNEHRVFAELGRWHPTLGSPIWSLVALAGIAMAMVLSVGTKTGRDVIDRVLLTANIGNVWFDFPLDDLKKKEGIAADTVDKLKAVNNKNYSNEAVALAELDKVLSGEERVSYQAKLRGYQKGPMPWDKYFGGFDTLFAGTAPVFWAFFLLTGLALFVLRENDKETERPFLVPGYPYVPTIFCAMCLFGLYSALKYAELVALIGLVPLLIGVPLYLFGRRVPSIPEKLPTEPAPPPPLPVSETPPAPAPAEERIQPAADEHVQNP